MARLEPRDKIELTIRAAKLAKLTLNMVDCSEPALARLHFVAVVKELKDIDDMITRLGA